eukprot:TRINITY_DN2371_c0_g1_i5.p1 TRINITY_DN2371_c0_g1~~TRINITY_DN2371_c0_g1_i5.p1  ORF type:complete len:284 (-),score=113.00 TRINITY_DN2371_c0_g1_i5:475-1305(-)
MIRRPPRSTHCISSAASDVYKRQVASKPKFYWRPTSFLSRDSISYYGKNVGMDEPSPVMRARSILSKLTEGQRKAIDKALIKQTFADVKRFSVGAQKPGNPGVKVKRVMDIQPFFEYIPNRIVMTIFDHDVKEDLHEAAKEQLDKSKSLNELLVARKCGKGRNKSIALYTKTSSEPLVAIKEDDLIHLGNAEYQLRREYDYFISTESQLKHNVLLYMKAGKVRYMKPAAIFTMNKKKVNPEAIGIEMPPKIHIGARGYTKEEIVRNNKKYEAIGVS